jgi:hypothetical protein
MCVIMSSFPGLIVTFRMYETLPERTRAAEALSA